MTNQEAIKRLQDLISVPDEMIVKYDGVINEEQRIKLEEVREIECMSIAALDKQIPKKVNIQRWIDTKCKCGYIFSVDYEDGYYDIPHNNKTNYCPNCGQRLDWSK